MRRLPRASLATLAVPAGALALGIAAPARAQSDTSVTLYGIVDAAVEAARNGSTAGTIARVQPSVGVASRFGVRGVERLGDSLRATFTLEMGINPDTGEILAASSNPGFVGATPIAATQGFGRRAIVGIEGAWGALNLGRDYTPFFWAHIGASATGYGYYGSNQSFYDLTGTGPERSARASNAIFYATPSFGGLTARAMYSFGAESGGGAGDPPTDANRMWGLGAEYNAKGLYVGLGYQTLTLATITGTGASAAFTGATTERKDWTVGAKYTFGAFALAAGHARSDPTGPNNAGSQTWVGGTLKIGTGTAGLQLQQIEREVATGTKPSADVLSLSYAHPLSRRTTVYATYGYTRNNDVGNFRLYGAATNLAPSSPGTSPAAFAIGLSHAF